MIIFTGVAGTGKSVQGKLIADELGLPWLSTGEFLRMLIAGSKRREMLSGKLLEDKEIIALVQKIFGIINTNREFVLDGFPRTLTQADWLLNQVKHGQLKIKAVINLTASEDVVRERLLNRGRQDDYDQAINKRLLEFREAVVPMLAHFKQAGVPVYTIDGEQSIEDVHKSIKQVLK